MLSCDVSDRTGGDDITFWVRALLSAQPTEGVGYVIYTRVRGVRGEGWYQ